MKKSFIISTLAVALISIPANGYSKPQENDIPAASSLKNASAQIHRVSEEELKENFTARDLIGAEIQDLNGEKVGNVSDVSLPKLESIKSAIPGTHKKDSRSDMASKSQETIVYISIGGLLGIGDDIVAVPASRISFDHDKKQYVLSAMKTEVVALTEQDPAASKKLYSSKQSFVSDVEAVRNSLKNIEGQAGLKGLTVEEGDGNIILNGTADSEMSKRTAEKVARNKTDLEIVNNISVSEK